MTRNLEGEAEAESYTDSWLWLSEGLIGGIHHALNNRMGALSGAAQVLEADLPPAHPLAGTMAKELHRFEETAGLLRRLTGGWGEFEPVQVEDIVSASRQLFEIHHAYRDLRLQIACEPDLLPLWTQPAGLLRAVLLMLAAAAKGSGEGEVKMTVSGDAAFVEISIEAPGDMADDGEEDTITPGITARQVDALARKLGGSLGLEEVKGVSWWVLRIPTLPEARRQERELALAGG